MKKEIPVRTVLMHAVLCIAFLMLPFVSTRHQTDVSIFSFGPPEIQNFAGSFLLALFFYANYYYFQPLLINRRRYFLWGVVALASFFISLVVAKLFVDQFDFHQFEMHRSFPPPFSGRLSMSPHEISHHNPAEEFMREFQLQELSLKFLFILLVSFLLRANRLWQETREEKRNAELSFLKSQVNPHFLFNTLNAIYSLSLERSVRTSESIVKLSELMRYVVSEIDKDYVTLGSEINYLQKYIDLQRLRLGDTVRVHFDCSGADYAAKISPLLLVVFVENAFKYGIDTSKISEIDIRLTAENGNLYFTTKNQLGQKNEDSTTGKGLDNVKRRLELIYPQRHILKMDNFGGECVVSLEIRNI